MTHPMFDRIDRRREILQRQIDAKKGAGDAPAPPAAPRPAGPTGILTQHDGKPKAVPSEARVPTDDEVIRATLPARAAEPAEPAPATPGPAVAERQLGVPVAEIVPPAASARTAYDVMVELRAQVMQSEAHRRQWRDAIAHFLGESLCRDLDGECEKREGYRAPRWVFRWMQRSAVRAADVLLQRLLGEPQEEEERRRREMMRLMAYEQMKVMVQAQIDLPSSQALADHINRQLR